MTEFCKTPAKQYKDRFQLTNFVETGCYRGEGIAHATLIGFEKQKIYSCDIRKEAVDECLSLFPESNIIVGDSISFLTRLLPTLSGKTFFWLDAHFPAHYGVKSETEIEKMPMFEEVQLIKNSKKDYANDVIFCDDMHVIKDRNNPHYRSAYQFDEYFDVTADWITYTKILSDTHSFSSLQIGECIGIFYPK